MRNSVYERTNRVNKANPEQEQQIETWVSEICAALSQRGITPTCAHIEALTDTAREGRWLEGFSPSVLAEQLMSMTASAPAAVVEVVVGHSERSILHEDAVRLPRQIERGLTGLSLRYGGKTIRLSPSTMRIKNKSFPEALGALMRSIPHADESANSMEKEARKLDVASFSTCQFVIPSIGSGSKLLPVFRGKPVVPLASVSFEQITTLARSLADWMKRNVAEDGRLTYCYHPSEDFSAPNTNRIREFMGAIALFRMALFFENDAMLALAEKNLRYNLSAYYRDERDYGVIIEGKKVKLGAAALAALAIRQSSKTGRYEGQAKRLMRFTEMMWDESGSFRTFLRPSHLDGNCQNFYPGETLLFWAENWTETRDPMLRDKIEASFLYYRDWHRANRNPAFVPWHTQACFLLWRETGDARFKDFVLEMNDWLLPFQQWETVADFPDAQGRFYDPKMPFGPPHASSTGVYLEGLIDAFKLADQTGDKVRALRYARAIHRGLRNVMQLQFAAPYECAGLANPEKTLGGIRTTEYDNVIRIDNVQHNLMAVLKILQAKAFPWDQKDVTDGDPV